MVKLIGAQQRNHLIRLLVAEADVAWGDASLALLKKLLADKAPLREDAVQPLCSLFDRLSQSSALVKSLPLATAMLALVDKHAGAVAAHRAVLLAAAGRLDSFAARSLKSKVARLS